MGPEGPEEPEAQDKVPSITVEAVEYCELLSQWSSWSGTAKGADEKVGGEAGPGAGRTAHGRATSERRLTSEVIGMVAKSPAAKEDLKCFLGLDGTGGGTLLRGCCRTEFAAEAVIAVTSAALDEQGETLAWCSCCGACGGGGGG